MQLTEMDVPQGFELVAFPTSVPVGGSGTIAVRYNGGYSRSFGAIRFATTDPDLPEFWFNVEGAATESVPTAAPRLAMLAPAATYQLGTPAVGIDDEANLIAGGSPVAKIYARWEGGRRAGDAMVVRNDGGISVDGADISYDGVKIATIDNPGAAPNDLEIAMLPTVAATNERVLAILEAIGFESSSTESGPGFTRFLVETVDGVESTHAFKTVRAHEQLFDYAEVESVQFGGESQQRSLVNSITVGFDQVVEVQDGAFELRKRGADGGVVDIAISTQDVDNKTVATLTFIGQFSEHSSLVDGNYELMLVGDKIVGPHRQGADVDGDNMRGGVRRIGTVESDRFYRYFGDLDADRTVGFLDYTEFRNTFGDAAGSDDFNEAFDFNADGVIGFVDFSEFRKRFGKSLDF